ncbi:hypothetical protein L1887_48020 [Cichorium endivia]|nr:hypothetical protein L1887_48020 [Cichorium endivia]
MLIEAADGVIMGTHSLEQLIVASNEVSAATAQVVAASRVKAEFMSKTQDRLERAAKAVTDACRALVKQVKTITDRQSNGAADFDYSQMAVHEFKVKEMEQQVEVLKLEKELTQARRATPPSPLLAVGLEGRAAQARLESRVERALGRNLQTNTCSHHHNLGPLRVHSTTTHSFLPTHLQSLHAEDHRYDQGIMSAAEKKQEADFSADVETLIPEAQSLAASNQLSAALERVFALEKKARNAADLNSTTRLLLLACLLVRNTPSPQQTNWDLLAETVTSLSKKHGQLKMATTRMVQLVMCFVYPAVDPEEERRREQEAKDEEMKDLAAEKAKKEEEKAAKKEKEEGKKESKEAVEARRRQEAQEEREREKVGAQNAKVLELMDAASA